MKTLYLVRHAKSSWKLDYLEDFERPLNKRGKRDAPLMGRALRERSVLPDILLSSLAARAASTARILAAAIGYPPANVLYTERLYDAGVKDLLELVKGLDNAHSSAMLVGHNPGLTMAVKRLSGTAVGDVPTAGVVAVEFSGEHWRDIAEGSGRVLFVDAPKQYRSEPGLKTGTGSDT